MSPRNRSDRGYERPQAVPYFVGNDTSGSPAHTIRCSALPDAYACGTRFVRQPVIQFKSPGPLYQLVSIFTGASWTKRVFSAPSASGPMPNRSFGTGAVAAVPDPSAAVAAALATLKVDETTTVDPLVRSTAAVTV